MYANQNRKDLLININTKVCAYSLIIKDLAFLRCAAVSAGERRVQKGPDNG